MQDLVFSVKLHFGLTLYPLSLPLVPYPLVLFLSRNLGEGYCELLGLEVDNLNEGNTNTKQ